MLLTRVFIRRMSANPPRQVIWESEGLLAYLHPRPWTPGTVILEGSSPGRPGGSIFHLQDQEYLCWMMAARAVAELLCDKLKVRRCALVARPHADKPAQPLTPSAPAPHVPGWVSRDTSNGHKKKSSTSLSGSCNFQTTLEDESAVLP